MSGCKRKRELLILAVWCVGCFLPGPAGAEESDRGLLFHAGFDGTLTADSARGNPEPFAICPINAPIFRDGGIRGKGLKCGNGFVSELGYQNLGNFSAPSGTVSFWIQPVDWQGAAGKAKFFNLFFQGVPGKGYSGIYLQRWGQAEPVLTYYSIQFSDRKDIYLPYPPSAAWKNGEWHHVAMAWDTTAARFFADGVLAGTGIITKPFTAADLFAKQFLLGSAGNEHTLLDEVRIWDRALSPEEITRLWHEKRGDRP